MLDCNRKKSNGDCGGNWSKSKLNDSRLSLDMLVVKEPEDPNGWVLCDMDENSQEEEENEDDYIIY